VGDEAHVPPLSFVLKVVSRCNLNCSYCYVYNKGDETWRDRPGFISDDVFRAALERIRSYCYRSGQETTHLTFHGGEPCLAGPERFGRWCRMATEVLGNTVSPRLAVQTNATLLDQRWMKVFVEHDVTVSVSMDGPKEIHDAFRVTARGKGSYDAVLRGIDLLHDAGILLRVLSVVQPGADGVQIHRHFLGLGAKSIDYLLPDFTHDTIAPVRLQHGPTPCADFLLPILEDWWKTGFMDVKVGILWNMSQIILGGRSYIDYMGNRPFQFLFVEADGAIEGLDVLRVCNTGAAATGLNVVTDHFEDIGRVSDFHRKAIFEGLPLPEACHSCVERTTCGGGYLPHRYSHERGFDNPTVWCADMLRLLGRLRELLNVSAEETALRRRALLEIGALS